MFAVLFKKLIYVIKVSLAHIRDYNKSKIVTQLQVEECFVVKTNDNGGF
jgi:hypothetical protein